VARTYRRDDREGTAVRDGKRTSHYWRKECKEVRVRHARDTRHETRQAIHQGDFDSLPDYPHTSGWETN
jgi:hypothetical protein